MVTATTMTLNEFLELPETEPPSEFVCGRVIPKPMPTWFHGTLAARIAGFFTIFFMRKDEGYVSVEVRHASMEEQRAYLPDVSVTRWNRAPQTLAERRQGVVLEFPDIAIEIVSPDDRPSQVADKLAFYLKVGVPLVWIVDPDDRSIAAYRLGESVRIFTEPQSIDAEPVFADFSMSLTELFSILDRRLES